MSFHLTLCPSARAAIASGIGLRSRWLATWLRVSSALQAPRALQLGAVRACFYLPENRFLALPGAIAQPLSAVFLSNRTAFFHPFLTSLTRLLLSLCFSASLSSLNMAPSGAPSSRMPPNVPSFSNNPPFASPFALRIKHVLYEDEHQRTPSPPEGPDFFWRPSASSRFVIHPQHPDDWWIWDPGSHTPHYHLQRLRPFTADEFSEYRPYKSCTMVWAPERQHYLHIPIDCTVPDQSINAHVWRRLSFGYDEHPNRAHIAVVGHHRTDYWLRFPAPRSWFPQLLPSAYQSQEDTTLRCGLAGDLSILVALIAFSTTPEGLPGALDQSFRRDLSSTVFQPHTRPQGPRQCLVQSQKKLLRSNRVCRKQETLDSRRDRTRPYQNFGRAPWTLGEWSLWGDIQLGRGHKSYGTTFAYRCCPRRRSLSCWRNVMGLGIYWDAEEHCDYD